MSEHEHGSESVGSNQRDRARPRFQRLKRAHRDWRVWTVAALMLAVLIAGVMTDSLFFGTGTSETHPVPTTNAP